MPNSSKLDRASTSRELRSVPTACRTPMTVYANYGGKPHSLPVDASR